MKKLLLAAALFCALPIYASTTLVTATVTDSDGQIWLDGTWTASLMLPSGPFGNQTPTVGGVAVPVKLSGVMNSSGVLTATLTDTSSLDQSGGQWNITVCPNAAVSKEISTGCFVAGVKVVGATLDLSSTFSGIPAPRVPAGPTSYAYSDIEILPVSIPGMTYYNTGNIDVTKGMRVWDGQKWQGVGAGGGSSNIEPTPQYRLLLQPDLGTLPKGGPSNIYTDSSRSSIFIPGNTTLGDGALAISRNYAPASITQFGAKCDGVTDDSAAINAAIASKSNIIAPPKSTCVVASYLEYVKASSIPYLKFDLNGSTLLFTGDGGGACSRMTNGLIQVHPSEGNGIHITNGTMSANNANAGCFINFSQTSANSGDGYSHNIWLDYLTFIGTDDGPTAYGTNNLIGIWTFFSGELRIEHNTFITFGANAIQLGGSGLPFNQTDIVNISHNNFQGTYRHGPQILVDSPEGVQINNNNFEVSGVSQTGSSPSNSSIRDNWFGDGCPGMIDGTVTTSALTSNVVTMTMATRTRLRVGDSIIVSGSTNPVMNGTFTVTATPTPRSFSFAAVGADQPVTPDTPTWYATVDVNAVYQIAGGSSSIDANFIYAQRCHGLGAGINVAGGDTVNITNNSISNFGTGITFGTTSTIAATGFIASNKVASPATNGYVINASATTWAGNVCSNGTVCLNVAGGSGNVFEPFKSFATTYATCAGGVSGNHFTVNAGTIATCQGANDVSVPNGQTYMPGSLSWGSGTLIPSSNSVRSAGRINNPLNYFVVGSFTPSLTTASGEDHFFASAAPDQGCKWWSAGGGDGSGVGGTLSTKRYLGLCGAGSTYGTGLFLVSGNGTVLMAIDSTATLSGSTIARTVASGTAALGTAAIASGACATAVTVAAAGAATTDSITYNPNADITAVTGYAPVTTGQLAIYPYPTAGNVNFKVCNPTSASITPGAVTLNWRVVR